MVVLVDVFGKQFKTSVVNGVMLRERADAAPKEIRYNQKPSIMLIVEGSGVERLCELLLLGYMESHQMCMHIIECFGVRPSQKSLPRNEWRTHFRNSVSAII